MGVETQSRAAVRGSNIHKKFILDRKQGSELHVLKGIDIEIRSGEVVSIVGPSGAGKSTLLHILGGLDHPTEGNVYWDDEDIFKLNSGYLARRRAKAIGFVFQFHHLLPEFDSLENVAIAAMIGGTPQRAAFEKAAKSLAAVGVEHRARHKPSELSGGEQQRVAVARAFVNGPRVILADEPSGNLDSTAARSLHELLFELNERDGQTFVIVTHNEKLAEKSHRVLRMVDGRFSSGKSD
jgi:lipoprotein-releasing system ATP-binding protein